MKKTIMLLLLMVTLVGCQSLNKLMESTGLVRVEIIEGNVTLENSTFHNKVTVSAKGKSTTTNSDGYYMLHLYSIGSFQSQGTQDNFTVEFNRENYEPKSIQIEEMQHQNIVEISTTLKYISDNTNDNEELVEHQETTNSWDIDGDEIANQFDPDSSNHNATKTDGKFKKTINFKLNINFYYVGRVYVYYAEGGSNQFHLLEKVYVRKPVEEFSAIVIADSPNIIYAVYFQNNMSRKSATTNINDTDIIEL